MVAAMTTLVASVSSMSPPASVTVLCLNVGALSGDPPT